MHPFVPNVWPTVKSSALSYFSPTACVVPLKKNGHYLIINERNSEYEQIP